VAYQNQGQTRYIILKNYFESSKTSYMSWLLLYNHSYHLKFASYIQGKHTHCMT